MSVGWFVREGKRGTLSTIVGEQGEFCVRLSWGLMELEC